MPEGLTIVRSNNVELKNGRFSAKNLDPNNESEMDKAHLFRYKVFSKELGWEHYDAIEYDQYDLTSEHFGVFSESGSLVGYSRLHLPEGRFMLENEFADLVEPTLNLHKKEDTVEASRFAISHGFRRTKEGFRVTELLCKTMCFWAKKNGIRYWYMVLDKNYLEFLRLFFPIEPVGLPKEYEPGLASVAVIVDLNELGSDEANMFWATLGDKPKPRK